MSFQSLWTLIRRDLMRERGALVSSGFGIAAGTAVLVFFLAVMHFLANPFARLDFVPADGQGINPLLTHFGMFIHPPVMMAGLVSVTVPFAFAMSLKFPMSAQKLHGKLKFD